MSQEKVDYRKEQKKNRKKILRKQRREHIALITGGILVAAVLLGWVGYSAYNNYEQKKAENPTYYAIDIGALTGYLSQVE